MLYFGGREIGGGGPRGNVPVKNNANRLCFKRLSIYISIPFHWLKLAVAIPEEKCNHDLYVSKC